MDTDVRWRCELEKRAKASAMDGGGGDDFGQAALLFTQAIHAGGPPSAALFAERAQAFIEEGNFSAAAADAGRAADLDPTMRRAHLRKARACIELQRYDSAMAAVEAGAALAPRDARFARLMEELNDKLPRTSQTEAATAAATAAQKGGEGSDRIEPQEKKDDEKKLDGGDAGQDTSGNIAD